MTASSDGDGNIDGIKWPKKDSWWDPWVWKLMHGTWSLMHDDGLLMYDGGDCNLNHMANYIRVYFNSMRNSLEGGPDRAQSPLRFVTSTKHKSAGRPCLCSGCNIFFGDLSRDFDSANQPERIPFDHQCIYVIIDVMVNEIAMGEAGKCMTYCDVLTLK